MMKSGGTKRRKRSAYGKKKVAVPRFGGPPRPEPKVVDVTQYCLLDFDIFPTNANANDDDYCRIAVVYDRQSNGAAPAYADISCDG